ncbi:MAG: altronate dehydratase [Clostridia bacterium]|nr:altronate dehydratase [Clostridia bacterium]
MKLLQIHPSDTVAVAVEAIQAGTALEAGGYRLTAADPIPAGHKIALRDIPAGENVIKYACPIGHAVTDIPAGSHVHTHNVKSNLSGQLSYTYTPDFIDLSLEPPRTFQGYRRPDGKVGIRNEVWIVPTVGCVNSIVREMEARAQSLKTENIDSIAAFCHPYGCSQLGDDQALTLAYLAGLIRHPNAAAVLVVGLGCENGNIDELKKAMGSWDDNRVKFLTAQDCEDEIADALVILKDLCRYADSFRRTECPASELVIGLKCGGSDGFSGITANPLLGALSDRLIAQGGSAILTEVPEMFGAETLLMNRCRTEKQFDDTVALINDFKAYFLRYGEKTDENPSPGNKAGGITTLEDKSLGCTQKGGTAPVEDVLRYGDPVRQKGLSLLQAPGNDLVASGALMASGAQMVLFTTGRGTPFGCPVPTVKISSNTALYDKKRKWIDFDAGQLLAGVSMETLTERFLMYVLDLASGKIRARSEALDRHDLAIFKDGVTL